MTSVLLALVIAPVVYAAISTSHANDLARKGRPKINHRVVFPVAMIVGLPIVYFLIVMARS